MGRRRYSLVLPVVASALCVAVLSRPALSEIAFPVFGYACMWGCNNADGCSVITSKYTQWTPHVECRLVIGMSVTCHDAPDVPRCYEQWTYQGSNCTGRVL